MCASSCARVLTAWGVVDVAADPHGEAGGVGVVVGAGAVASFEVWALEFLAPMAPITLSYSFGTAYLAATPEIESI